jgi:hypothetical protein
MAATGQKGLYVNMNTGAVQAYLPPFRNALINGDMRINQRGTSTNLASLTAVATATPGSWVVDRWNVYRPGFVAGASIGQGTGMVYADLPFSEAGIATYGRVGRTAANAATTAIYCDYNMESQDSYRLVGKTVTLSFYYRCGVNFSDNSLTATLHSGTATDAALRSGTFTSFATTAFAKSASWVRATVTGTVPTSAAQVCLRFSYTPVGTAGNADHFDVTGVQLELGNVATPFEVRPFQVELQTCRRYHLRRTNLSSYERYGWWVPFSTINGVFSMPVSTDFRVTPVPTISSVSDFLFGVAGTTGGATVTSFTIDSASYSNYIVNVNITGTGFTGTSTLANVYVFGKTAGTVWMSFDAEL